MSRLGRGLDALMQGAEKDSAAGREVSLRRLTPGRFQPRRRFPEDAMTKLADSIRRHGVIQPIVARQTAAGGLEIIAGERRWRAAKMAGLKTAPVIVREMSDSEAQVCSLVENLQRADLNPAEQARGLSRLIAELNLTHAQAGEAVGLSRPAVSNLLRLLELSPPALQMLADGLLEMAHARALLPLPQKLQYGVAQTSVARRWTVPMTENAVKKILGGDDNRGGKTRQKDDDTRRLEAELSAGLSARVEIAHRKDGGGTLSVHYGSLDSLDRILRRLK